MKTYFILIPVMERLTNTAFHEGLLKLKSDATDEDVTNALRESLLDKMPADEIETYSRSHPIAIYCEGKWWVYRGEKLEEME